ncbi:MAG: hypothetical protein FJ304_22750 [Planctomycetes bacterium]|nr:hypothetical protein [Planctomycetota bacterium]
MKSALLATTLFALSAPETRADEPIGALEVQFYRHQEIALKTSHALAGKIAALQAEVLRYQSASLDGSKALLARLDALSADCAKHRIATQAALADLRATRATAAVPDARVAELVRKQTALDAQHVALVAQVTALEQQLKARGSNPTLTVAARPAQSVPAKEWERELAAQRRVIQELEDLLNRKK